MEQMFGGDNNKDKDGDEEDEFDRNAPVTTNMHVELSIGELGLTLNEEPRAKAGPWRHMAEFVVSGLDVTVDMRSNTTMSASGQVIYIFKCFSILFF